MRDDCRDHGFLWKIYVAGPVPQKRLVAGDGALPLCGICQANAGVTFYKQADLW